MKKTARIAIGNFDSLFSNFLNLGHPDVSKIIPGVGKFSTIVHFGSYKKTRHHDWRN